jgi:ribosomal protein L11 methyltransferase
VSNKKTYSYIIVKYPNESEELIEINNFKACEEFGCEGIEEFSIEEETVDEILGKRAYSGGDIPEEVIDEVETTTKEMQGQNYKYYFYSQDHESLVDKFKKYLSIECEKLSFESKTEEWEDWNEQWRKHYKTLEISPRLRVVPEWLKEENKEFFLKDIYIYPGMGFGTGNHETTYLCLELFDEIADELKDKECFDFGCGSGILGIAAIKLNKMKVEFCDIDADALDNCVQNLELNFSDDELDGHRLVIRDRFKVEKQFSLVFANILEHVLELEKDLLLDSVKENGYLIVSGLLNEQVENIKEKYNSLTCVKSISKGDWSAILFRK